MDEPVDAPYLTWPGPLALAHRGGGGEAPENSRAALEHMAALGFRYFETDARATADGVVVLQHDADLDRTTDGTGPLARRTWAEVARMRDRSGSAPLRLRDVLAEYPELRLNIDAKEDTVVGPLVREITDAGAEDRVCLASFSDARLRRMRAAFGGQVATSLGQRETARLVLAAAARVPPGAARRRPLRVPAPGGPPPRRAVAVQVPPRHGGIPVVTAPFVALAHRLGLAVHVWTVDDATAMTRLLDLGVDGIVTDRPRVLRAVLEARGEWYPPL
ncbi:glycerophosphodiester phosphodiesterase [Georgenia faecalis]|uniref:Glycerophosphodiester phosphodiesterase n=1 Tax=Georgenia faecalis TaxID=2483799 RepID=A0ABV9DDM5_9MICO|nr:glycerophosphodiester phosphodiesterase [Georgenia faecalis]